MPSVSKKQHNLMALVANDPKAAKRLGIKQSVGEEFMKADKGKKFGSGGKTKKMAFGGMSGNLPTGPKPTNSSEYMSPPAGYNPKAAKRGVTIDKAPRIAKNLKQLGDTFRGTGTPGSFFNAIKQLGINARPMKKGGYAKGGMFKGKETYGEELAEAKAVKSGKVSPSQFAKKEKAEGYGHEEKGAKKLGEKIKSGKVSPAKYAKMETSEEKGMKKGGKVKKMAVGGSLQQQRNLAPSTNNNPPLGRPARVPQYARTTNVGGMSRKFPGAVDLGSDYSGKVKKMAVGGRVPQQNALTSASNNPPLGRPARVPQYARPTNVGGMPRKFPGAVDLGSDYSGKVKKMAVGGSLQQQRNLAPSTNNNPPLGRPARVPQYARPTNVGGMTRKMAGGGSCGASKYARGGGIEKKGKTKGKMV